MSVFQRKSASWVDLLGCVSCVGVMVLSSATSALAAESESGSETATLEEVTVTAQRREENSQSVPIAINTISGEDVMARGAISLQTLSAIVPNVTGTGASSTHIYIRGVGAFNASPNNEPSAATYVDGVYMPSSFGLGAYRFNNIERLEVLKGPQGTLFGRNATAGVIQVVTPDPKHDPAAKLNVGYGNYETINADAYATAGISENLAADVSVLYEDQGEGFGFNPTQNAEIFRHRNFAARTKWLFTPSDATRITTAVDYSKFWSDGSNTQMVPGSIASADHVSTYPGRFISTGDLMFSNDEEVGASIRLDQDIAALHLASITAYRKVKGHWSIDQDIVAPHLAFNETWNDSDYYTQELQLSNKESGKVDWLMGAFFYGNTVKGAYPRINTGPATPGGYREVYGRQKTRSGSLFGQATTEVFTDTKLTLGLRYTDEKLEADGRQQDQAGNIVAGPFFDEIKFDPWTWRAALDHQFTPDVLGYVSWNRGFKSGGYNLISPGSASFLPETLDAYEVGVKSEFMDRRVRLNVAAFYYDYKDIQVAIVPGGGTQIFTNAAAARNYGIDATLDFAATQRLTLSMGLGLLDAKYKDYPNAQGFTNTGVAVPIANAKGRDLPYAPPTSAFLSANYNLPTSVGDFKFSGSYAWNDVSYVTPSMLLERPATRLLSGTVEWWSSRSSFGVRLWGRNLLDEYLIAQRIESSGGHYQVMGAPRTYGLTLMTEF